MGRPFLPLLRIVTRSFCEEENLTEKADFHDQQASQRKAVQLEYIIALIFELLYSPSNLFLKISQLIIHSLIS